MLIDALVIAAGIAVTIALAEVVIRNAVLVAERFHVSPTFIGLTLLSIGTSIPEIFTHVAGSLRILREPELLETVSALVVGTNIGSDIFQQNLVLPLVGLIGTVIVRQEELWAEAGALIGATALLWAFALGGVISRAEGVVLVVAYGAYLVALARSSRVVEQAGRNRAGAGRRVLAAVAVIFAAFAVMAVATDQVVAASTRLVVLLPVSASLFGVVVLGVASALPELTTALISVARRQSGISAGVLIGSNITNPLFALGLGAAISTFAVPDVVVVYDLPVKLVTAGLLFLFLRTGQRLARPEAATLILLFFAYLAVRTLLFPTDF